jgi:hypothetical protein
VKDTDDQDESTHKNMSGTDEEVQDLGLAFDDDLNVNNIEVK